MKLQLQRPARILASSFLLAAAPGALAQPAPLSADAWRAVQAAAQKEGRVVLYGQPVPPVLARIKADFERAHPGIVLEYTRIAGSAIIGRVEAERQSGADGGDVLFVTETLWLEKLAKEGALKAPSGPSARAWPAEFMVAGIAPVLSLEPIVMTYNTNIVKTELTGYQDILRPEFKGKVGTSEPVVPPVTAWYEWLQKTQGADFLAKFAAQSPRAYVGAVPTTQAAASGEISVSAFSKLTTALPLIEQGAPIKVVVTKPSFGFRYQGAVVAWSKRPNAALVLMDYLTSVRGQTTLSGRGETASPLPNIPGSLDARSINPFDEAPYTPEAMKAFGEKWRSMFSVR